MLGARFDEASLKNVSFKNCLAKYSNFSFGDLKSINFIDSNLEESIFQEVSLGKTSFKNTNIINGYFNKTSLNKIDFTDCDIAEISVEIKDLSGAIVSPTQALDLTRLLNITIK